MALAATGVALLGCGHAWGAEARSGIFEEVVADDFVAGEARTHYTLKTGGDSISVVPLSNPMATAGDHVKVVGEMEKGRLLGYVQPLDDPQPSSKLGTYTTAVVLAKLTSETKEPISPQTAQELVFTGPASANAFYQEESYGQIFIVGRLHKSGDIFGWYTLNYTPGASSPNCDSSTWQALADKKAQMEGVSLEDYDRVVYVMAGSDCGVSGDAGGTDAFIYPRSQPGKSAGVYIHEIGHTLGFDHANGILCRDPSGERISLSDNCTVEEYGDPFDTMGGGDRHNNARFLTQAGILTPSNIETVTEPGTYALRAALLPSLQPTVLKIPKLRNSKDEVVEWYELEIRQRGGVFEDVEDASMTGVSIRLSGPRVRGSYLVDTNPLGNGFFDAPLAVGKTFEYREVTIQTLAAANGEATVYVDPGPPRDEVAPTTPTGLHQTENPNGVELAWAAASDNVGVARYRVFRDGVEVGTNKGTTFVDAPASGSHTYGVYAEDEAGNRSLEPAALEVEASDVTPPTQPGKPFMQVGSDGVTLVWSASSDNFAITAYRILRNGVEIGTFTPEKFPVVLPHFIDAPLPSPGPYLYEIYAEDPSGNTSTSSQVTVTVPDTTAPTQPGAFSATLSPEGVDLSWTASNDDVGVVRYRILRDGSEVGETATPGYTDAPEPGAHTYRVSAEDAAGNHRNSRLLTVNVPDATAPSAPGGLDATVSPEGIDLSWTASGDDVGVVRYQVLRDGSEVGETATPGFTDAPSPGPGNYLYEVLAEDAAGNYAGSSLSVTVPEAREGSSDTVPGGGEEHGPELIPPQPPVSHKIELTLKVKSRSKGRVALAVQASGDEGIARVEIRVDGVLLKSKPGSSLRAAWAMPRCGAHRIVARAIGVESGEASKAVKVGRRCAHRGSQSGKDAPSRFAVFRPALLAAW